MKFTKSIFGQSIFILICFNFISVSRANDMQEYAEQGTKLIVFGSKDLSNSGIESLATSQTIYSDDFASAATKISDVIIAVPGISTNGQGGLWQSFSIRGMSRWRIQTMLDGVPIITDRRAGSAVSFVEPGLLGQVDVVKGAVSTLFGSGAIGGVVNLKPSHFDTSVITLDMGSFGNEKGLLYGSRTNEVAYGVAYRSATDDISNEDTQLNSDFEQFSALIKTSKQLTNDRTLSWMVIPTKGKNIGKSNSDYPSNKITHYPTEKHLIGKVSLAKKGAWGIELYTHLQDWQSEVVRVGHRKNIIDYNSLDWGVNTQFNWKQSDVNGRVGFDWFNREDVSIDEVQFNVNNSGINSEYFTDAEFNRSNLDASESQFSAYSDAQLALNKTEFHAGLRVSYYRQKEIRQTTNDNKLTGFIGLRYHATEDFNVNFQLGTGFRFPSLTEKYFYGTTGRGEIIGNTDLKPERALNKEITLTHLLKGFDWSLTYFKVDITDYIERYEIAPEVLQYQNITSGYISGIEATVYFQLSDNMRLNFSSQHQKGRSVNGDMLADISPDEYKLNYSYSASDWQFKAIYKYRLSKKNVADSELELDSVGLLDLSFQKALSDEQNVSLMIKNIFDKSYLETADDLSPYSRGLELSIKFDHYF